MFCLSRDIASRVEVVVIVVSLPQEVHVSDKVIMLVSMEESGRSAALTIAGPATALLHPEGVSAHSFLLYMC